jgi:hypothetical protein
MLRWDRRVSAAAEAIVGRRPSAILLLLLALRGVAVARPASAPAPAAAAAAAAAAGVAARLALGSLPLYPVCARTAAEPAVPCARIVTAASSR